MHPFTPTPRVPILQLSVSRTPSLMSCRFGTSWGRLCMVLLALGCSFLLVWTYLQKPVVRNLSSKLRGIGHEINKWCNSPKPERWWPIRKSVSLRPGGCHAGGIKQVPMDFSALDGMVFTHPHGKTCQNLCSTLGSSVKVQFGRADSLFICAALYNFLSV